MKHPSSIPTKFIMLGVKLDVIEVKKLDFCINCKKYSLEIWKYFLKKSMINSWYHVQFPEWITTKSKQTKNNWGIFKSLFLNPSFQMRSAVCSIFFSWIYCHLFRVFLKNNKILLLSFFPSIITYYSNEKKKKSYQHHRQLYSIGFLCFYKHIGILRTKKHEKTKY